MELLTNLIVVITLQQFIVANQLLIQSDCNHFATIDCCKSIVDTIWLYQISTVYVLNFYNIIWQLYLNKGKKLKKKELYYGIKIFT